MCACLLYAGRLSVVDKVNTVALSNDDHSEGLQSAAEFHNKPLAHFDFFPNEDYRETNASVGSPTKIVHPIASANSETADEVLLQLSVAFEIAVCVVLVMLFLERLQNFGKAQKQRSTVEKMEKLQLLKDQGVISDDEYISRRTKLLNSLSSADDAGSCWLCPCFSKQNATAHAQKASGMSSEADSPIKTNPTHGGGKVASTGPPTENKPAAQEQRLEGADEKRQAQAEATEGGAHQPDPEDPLRANEWPHIHVHVPRASRPAHDGPCARARDSSCGCLSSLYSRIAADLDEPPVRAALGLVLA
eukprot:CAMPEP_0172208616 /NCGR_PEP_ID=MMETSP1050-20130122/34582_1 /TAXON_ID=233186 /ORGANISM="Cryptomonas curvata, Strain CCAP979/52" /LENGTH=303 /DNA_ID=CAMNT_0012888249 /DNA_START=159 /DNA_END=1067 /DNA_ORIENTATION=+